MPAIGISLSGGGHRAALFGLGTLLYLADAGKNRDTVAIASVSGGSLTNGFVAQSVDFQSVGAGEFEVSMRPLARVLAVTGTILPPSLVTLAYLIALGTLVAFAVVGVWFLPLPIAVRVVLFVVALALAGAIARLRGAVAAHAFASRLYSPSGSATRLASLERSIDHLICTADLHAGENVYFSPSFVCSYRYGWGSPADLRLHVAVQASCALPGPFPPRLLPTALHRFEDPLPETAGTRDMVLVDGGVYDNMADQWALGMENRRERFGDRMKGVSDIDELIVVNASAGLEWAKLGWLLRVPVVGEIVALIIDSSILYDNGNSVRRELLLERFRQREQTGRGLRGALVHIPRSALHVPKKFELSPDPKARARAQAMLAVLRPQEDRWRQLAKSASTTKTGLSRLGTERAADILEHGYVLAMANLHVILDYPRLPLPERARFEEFASREGNGHSSLAPEAAARRG